MYYWCLEVPALSHMPALSVESELLILWSHKICDPLWLPEQARFQSLGEIGATRWWQHPPPYQSGFCKVFLQGNLCHQWDFGFFLLLLNNWALHLHLVPLEELLWVVWEHDWSVVNLLLSDSKCNEKILTWELLWLPECFWANALTEAEITAPRGPCGALMQPTDTVELFYMMVSWK